MTTQFLLDVFRALADDDAIIWRGKASSMICNCVALG